MKTCEMLMLVDFPFIIFTSQWLFKWLMLCSDSELLTQKPLLRWTSDDVDSWVSSIELWPKGSNITSVLEAQRISKLLCIEMSLLIIFLSSFE